MQKGLNKMTFTDREVRTIKAVLNDLVLNFSDDQLHKFIGSETIKEMKTLERKLHYADYCERHGIAYEDMTEEDQMYAYEEEYGY